jgi:hypothetical protein
LSADDGFAREGLMKWCEANRVDYLLGLAKKERLVGETASGLPRPKRAARQPESRASLEFHWSSALPRLKYYRKLRCCLICLLPTDVDRRANDEANHRNGVAPICRNPIAGSLRDQRRGRNDTDVAEPGELTIKPVASQPSLLSFRHLVKWT